MGATAALATRFRLREILDSMSPPMSQSELSRRSGVSMTTINSMALNKTVQVSLATLDALSKALGVEPGDLFARAPESKRKR